MKQYLSLREQYPRFAYRGYELEENDSCLKITYRFETLGLSEFAPVWVFPKAEGDCRRWSEDRLMQDMIFSLGMVELLLENSLPAYSDSGSRMAEPGPD